MAVVGLANSLYFYALKPLSPFVTANNNMTTLIDKSVADGQWVSCKKKKKTTKYVLTVSSETDVRTDGKKEQNRPDVVIRDWRERTKKKTGRNL